MAVKSFNARTGLSVGVTPIEIIDALGAITLPAGTTTLSPFKFTAGTNLSAPAAGAVEWDGTNLFITQTTGPTRKTIAYTDSNITGTATNATNTAITDDTTTNATMYPTWVTAATGNLPQKVSSSKLFFNPSTGTLTSTIFAGALSGNATTATTATNVAGGALGQLHYQTGVGTTGFVAVGTAGQLLQSAGSAIPVYTTATYPTTAGTAGKILRSNGTNILSSTATFADTYAASTILYSNGADTVTGLATANNGVLVTSGAGVPSISSTLPAALSIPGALISTSPTVSAAGTTQGTATALTSDYNVITTAASGTGVVLQTAAAGKTVIVVNKGANVLLVYPATGAAIDALGANVGISVPVSGWIEFNASSTTQWYSTANGSINTSALIGTISNAQLTNSSVTIGSTAVALGATVTTFVGLSSVTSTTFVGALTGNATTATSATTATNVAGGTAGALVYQTGAGATGFISAVAAGSLLVSNGTSTVPVYSTTPSITTSLTVPLVQGTGGTGGTLTLRGGTDTTGTVAINAATINSSVATLALFATPTTITLGAAATSLGLGASSGTTTVNNNLTVTGDLVVNGTTTTINATTISVDDKNIELGSVAVPSDSTADGGGITLKGTTDKTIIWDNANDNWSFNQNVNLSSTFVYKINNVSVLSATALGSSVVGSSLTSVGTLTSLTTAGQITSSVSTGTAPFVIASTTQVANLNAATSGTSTNIAGGATGSLPYQSGAGATAFLTAGTTSQVLVGGASAPSWSNTPTLTGTNFTGIPNAGLTNSSVTIGSTAVSLGATVTTFVGLTSVTSTTFVGALTGNASTVTTNANLTGPVTSTGNATAVTNNAITNAMLAQMPTLTIKGNNTGGSANAADLTVAQVNLILPVFTSALNGLVPLSGGGTTNFLRADGTWTVPGGGGTVTSIADGSTNGVIWTVATRTTTPVFTFSLGAITPTSVASSGAISGTTLTVGSGTTTSDVIIAGSMNRDRAGALTTAAVTLVDLDSWAAATFRSAKYVIQAVDTVTGNIYMTEVLVAKDNSNNVYITEYGTMASGSNIITLSADYDGSTNIRLRVTPASTNSTQMKFRAIIFNL